MNSLLEFEVFIFTWHVIEYRYLGTVGNTLDASEFQDELDSVKHGFVVHGFDSRIVYHLGIEHLVDLLRYEIGIYALCRKSVLDGAGQVLRRDQRYQFLVVHYCWMLDPGRFAQAPPDTFGVGLNDRPWVFCPSAFFAFLRLMYFFCFMSTLGSTTYDGMIPLDL